MIWVKLGNFFFLECIITGWLWRFIPVLPLHRRLRQGHCGFAASPGNLCLQKESYGASVSVNCLPHRREDLSVNPRTHIKAGCTSVIPGQESGDRRSLGLHWPASLAKAVSPRPLRDTVSRNKVGIGWLDLLSTWHNFKSPGKRKCQLFIGYGAPCPHVCGRWKAGGNQCARSQ